MGIQIKNEKWHDEFNEWYDKYLKKFGEHSLDRVITHDPLHFLDYTKEEIEELIKPIKKAIETNTPLEQGDKDMWDKLIF